MRELTAIRRFISQDRLDGSPQEHAQAVLFEFFINSRFPVESSSVGTSIQSLLAFASVTTPNIATAAVHGVLPSSYFAALLVLKPLASSDARRVGFR